MKRKLIIILITFLVISTTILTGCLYEIPENPNTFTRSILFDGLNRTYRVHIPPNINQIDSPAIVFVLHGGGGNGENTERTLTLGGFNNLSDEFGFIVIYPDGIDRNWNDGRNIKDTAHQEKIDDVGFLSTLIDNLTEEFNADIDKIFFTGISNGAMMSYRLAFDIPEKIAAIAPVAGAIPTDILPENISGVPLSVFVLSGTHDPLVPWEGGDIGTPNNFRGTCISVPESVEFWVKRNNCNSTPIGTWLPNKNKLDLCRIHCDSYENGDNNTEVVLYEIKRGGHTWPGGYQYFPKFLIGRTCRDIDANEEIWNFFDSHPKNRKTDFTNNLI
jgi:polyhydroxybutyrate depolymerase